jgi:hypothetical protein
MQGENSAKMRFLRFNNLAKAALNARETFATLLFM